MKKVLILLMVVTMVFGVSVFAFADDTTEETVCEISPEYVERFLEIKTEFINEKVADGTLDAGLASTMLNELETQTGHDTLMDLGFGIWLRDSEYAEEILDILPHKNMSTRGYDGERNENCLEDGTHRNFTDEEFEAYRAEHQNEGFGHRNGGGRGHRNN